jgi:PelA/Pel-15E family pectate lyase
MSPGNQLRQQLSFIVALVLGSVSIDLLAQESLRDEASRGLRRAVDFFHTQVAAHGGYVYRYSSDLSKREGEGKTGLDTVWVQPPGTPAVGLALLDAHERTKEKYLLDAARDAGECLIRGQLRSGGWEASIEFSEEGRRKHAYRFDSERQGGSNWTTFDDNKTQSAVMFLMELDRVLEFRDERVHSAAVFALDSVLKAQYPNGAWPQGYREFPDPAKYPIQPASYPADWPRKHPGADYRLFYTFNDNAIADTMDMLLRATRVYGQPKYRDAAIKAGGFILLAQMPEPQPAWAQQYNFEMHPVWARRFEPPAISGGESQGILRILQRLYAETGDKKFLAAVPPALDYLRRSRLPDGRLSRFYELISNKPLYFTRQYELTYDDRDLPTHYGFQITGNLDGIAREQERLQRMSAEDLQSLRERASRSANRSAPGESQVRRILAAMDERGAWVEEGRLRYHGESDDTRQVIETTTFIRNVSALSQYVAMP